MRTALAGMFIFCCYLYASNEDYKIQAAAAKEAKGDPARIWSRKCQREGKQIFASKSDKGPWVIKCVDGRVRT